MEHGCASQGHVCGWLRTGPSSQGQQALFQGSSEAHSFSSGSAHSPQAAPITMSHSASQMPPEWTRTQVGMLSVQVPARRCKACLGNQRTLWAGNYVQLYPFQRHCRAEGIHLPYPAKALLRLGVSLYVRCQALPLRSHLHCTCYASCSTSQPVSAAAALLICPGQSWL